MLIRMSSRPSSRIVASTASMARLGARDVGLNTEGAASERAYRRGRLIRFVAGTVVDERDVDARLRERRRDNRADALAAGDERNLAG